MTNKEIKQQIRKLKKLKLACQPGSKERISLHREIKELKEQLISSNVTDIKKEPIIKEIKKLDPLIDKIGQDLNKFTLEELKKHLTNLKTKKC